MKNSKRQVSKSRSTEGRREATARGRRIRVATDLTHCPSFDLQYGEDWKGGSPTNYYTIQYRGVKAHLRFDYMWRVKAPSLDLERTFLNQSPDTLATEIESWIDENLPAPATSPVAARLQQSSQAVRKLADRHGIPIDVADEIMLERSF